MCVMKNRSLGCCCFFFHVHFIYFFKYISNKKATMTTPHWLWTVLFCLLPTLHRRFCLFYTVRNSFIQVNVKWKTIIRNTLNSKNMYLLPSAYTPNHCTDWVWNEINNNKKTKIKHHKRKETKSYWLFWAFFAWQNANCNACINTERALADCVCK